MKKDGKTGIRQYITSSKLKRFSIFLLVAFLFLLLTKFSETYTQSFLFNVEVENLKDEVVLQKDSTSQLEVVLKGKGFSLLPYLFYNSKTIKLRAGKDTFKNDAYLYWDASNNRHLLRSVISNSIDILSVKPDTLAIQYITLSSKRVPVVVDKDINFAKGYDLSKDFELSTDSVKLVGPKDLLADINYIETELLTLNEVKKDIELRLNLKYSNNSPISVMPESVDVYGEVKQFTEGSLKLPISIRNLPLETKINYFPKDVELFYYVDLEHYKNVDQEDFELYVDFADVNIDDNRYLPIQIESKSNFIKSIRLNQTNIEYIILN